MCTEVGEYILETFHFRPPSSKHLPLGAPVHSKGPGPLSENNFLATSWILMELFLTDLSPAACSNREAPIAQLPLWGDSSPH